MGLRVVFSFDNLLLISLARIFFLKLQIDETCNWFVTRYNISMEEHIFLFHLGFSFRNSFSCFKYTNNFFFFSGATVRCWSLVPEFFVSGFCSSGDCFFQFRKPNGGQLVLSIESTYLFQTLQVVAFRSCYRLSALHTLPWQKLNYISEVYQGFFGT